MVLSGEITPSGQVFRQLRSSTDGLGIALAADVTFLGKTVHADVKPPDSIEFTYQSFSAYDSRTLSADEVAGGILQWACKQLGYTLLESLTMWKRPALPEALEDRDPDKAAGLYDHACWERDPVACTRLADLATRLFEAKGRRVERDEPAACTAAARMALLDKKPSTWQINEALAMFLRACDLGASDACQGAALILPRTPLADATPLLSGAHTVHSKTLGTIFAVRWGQWTTYDHGQATAWVTAPPPSPPKGARDAVQRRQAATGHRGATGPHHGLRGRA